MLIGAVLDGQEAEMPDQDAPRYADRLFPAPVDHGIARPDRAVSTVRSGTDTGPGGSYQNERWYQAYRGHRAIHAMGRACPPGGQRNGLALVPRCRWVAVGVGSGDTAGVGGGRQ